MQKKKSAFLVILLWLTFLIPFNAKESFAAQEDQIKIDKLQVSLWVEFDRPEKWDPKEPNALLMYNGSVYNKSTTDFNDRVGFYIPDDVYVNMICETEKGMACQPYKIDKLAKGSYISWKPTRPIKPGESFPFMLEVYFNSIKGSVDKTVDFTFTSSFDIDVLDMDIKAPLKGTNFKVEPLQQQLINDNGFNYYLYSFKNLKKDETKTFKISYTKEGSEPSVTPTANAQPPQNAGSVTSSAINQSKGRNWGIIFMILTLTAVIVGLLVMQIIKNNRYNKMLENEPEENKVKSLQATKSKTLKQEKAKIRKMLLDGKISEETYHELITDLEV